MQLPKPLQYNKLLLEICLVKEDLHNVIQRSVTLYRNLQ